MVTKVLGFLAAAALVPAVQAQSPGAEKLHIGKAIYEAGCAGCHGNDGRGAPDATVGFEKPDSFPDFTRCDQTTAEYNVDYKATIRGGAVRADFPRSCRRSAILFRKTRSIRW